MIGEPSRGDGKILELHLLVLCGQKQTAGFMRWEGRSYSDNTVSCPLLTVMHPRPIFATVNWKLLQIN